MKVKNDNRCRTCGHPHYWELYSDEIRECSHVLCKCKAENFIPLDNLEYLEYLYEVKKHAN